MNAPDTTASVPDGTAAQVPDDAPVEPGRRVRLEPTPPGFWRILIGLAIALLAPFFGILAGSGMGVDADAERMSPLYWGFFLGGLIGAAALVMAAAGLMTLLRHNRGALTGVGDPEGREDLREDEG